MTNKEKLIHYVEERLNFFHNDITGNKYIWSHQAFGAISLYCNLFPDEFEEINKIWEEKYRPIFF